MDDAQIVSPGAGDRIHVEMSIEPGSGRIDLMSNDRSWSNNTLFDISYFGSSDGGRTWAVQRVTKSSWDPSQYACQCAKATRVWPKVDLVRSPAVPIGGGTSRKCRSSYSIWFE